MAGSYRHVTDGQGQFSGMSCIDNLGDAHEALEECIDMIFWLAGGDLEKIRQAHFRGHLVKRCDHWTEDMVPPRNSDDFWEESSE